MIKVGVVGGTGYTGVELLRLLAAHPEVEVTAITSRGEAGVKVADYFPSLRGRYDLAFTDPASAPLKGCDCVFFATAVQLALLPLVETDHVDHAHLIADAKSGVSGAGRKAELDILFSEATDNFKAYAVKGHRHHPEILESLTSLESASGRHLGLTFVPHLVPMVRGILATVYARITSETDFQALFEKRYAKEPFVDVLPPNSQPETRWVRGTNQCRIAVHRPMDSDTLVVLAVEDNLVKGAAGQAVQNMNVMFGFPEIQGLQQIAVVP